MRRLILLTVALAALLPLCVSIRADENPDKTKVGDTVPAFNLQTLDGKTLTPASLKGKVVLLNFFATWCGPCNAEMPELESKVQQRFKDKPFLLVSVGREHTAAEVKAFAEKNHLTFTFAPDPKRENYSLFATEYIPRNYLIDANGKIIFQSMGYSEDEFKQLVDAIDKALSASAAPAN